MYQILLHLVLYSCICTVQVPGQAHTSTVQVPVPVSGYCVRLVLVVLCLVLSVPHTRNFPLHFCTSTRVMATPLASQLGYGME